MAAAGAPPRAERLRRAAGAGGVGGERDLNRRALLASAGVALVAARADAQQAVGDTSHGPTMSGPMDGTAYLPVRLAPKAGVTATMSDDERDRLEHSIKCQCGCVLDVYTCRTTDFTCPVSPAMRQDMLTLIDGGHTAPEILLAFQAVYGERVLMSPVREGFNWLGYLMPSIVILGAGVAVWRWTARRRAIVAAAPPPPAVTATPDEVAQIEAAVRTDE